MPVAPSNNSVALSPLATTCCPFEVKAINLGVVEDESMKSTMNRAISFAVRPSNSRASPSVLVTSRSPSGLN